LNAPYSARAWATLLPRLQDNLVEAAARAEARLVVLENLYMLGAPSGAIDETTPVRPCSRKGEIRARMSEALWSAHRAGRVRAVAGRASHLFGPGVEQSQVGAHLFARVLSGRSARLVGDPARLHSFAYAPDVARGLAALGEADDAWLGRAHVLPVMPAMANGAFHAALFDALGVAPRIDRIGPLAMRLVGLFVPVLRESVEMRYEFDADYVVDDRAFRAAFDARTTPLDEALRETARWARSRFGAGPVRRASSGASAA
jgi:nucleoside-diphosphate-sugar epimerase